MQRIYNVNFKVTCKTDDVLKKMHEHREKHAKIVRQARDGYKEKAKEALENKLAELATGKMIDLSFSLKKPISHLSAYDTIITMLQMHTEPTIVLSSDEVRQFLEDKWEWTGTFMTINSIYSQDAAANLISLTDTEEE